MRKLVHLVMLSALVALTLVPLAGCGGKKGTTPTQPDPPDPTPVLKTETFTGTIVPSGERIFSFSTLAGDVTATVTSLQGAASIGVAIGTYANNACTPGIFNDGLAPNTALVLAGVPATTACVRVYDPQASASSLTFSVSVRHWGTQ